MSSGADDGGGEVLDMGDGTKNNLYTREDVLSLIEETGGTAEDLDLPRRGGLSNKSISL